MVDQVHEVLRRAVAGSGREVARALITPGAVEGVLHDRHELHVREARLRYVVGEPMGELPVAEQPAVRSALPRAQVDLVDRDRSIERVAVAASVEPRGVAPFVVQVPDLRGRAGRSLPRDRVGIAFVGPVVAVVGAQMNLVEAAVVRARYRAFPDARLVGAGLERVAPGRPVVELADDRHFGGIRRPDREPRAFGFSEGKRTELFVQRRVSPFFEKVDVAIGEAACGLAHHLRWRNRAQRLP